MKKKGKKILLFISILLLLSAAVIWSIISPLLAMDPAETEKIAGTCITAINNGMNSVYMIESNEGYVMVDAGSDPDALLNALEETDIDRSGVAHILLTHADYDHVASLALFPNAKIYINEDEVQMINGRTKRGNDFNELPDGIALDSLILLKDEQKLEVGGRTIRCVKAPGHTPGSMVYVIDGRYLFTGDAFMVKANTISTHPFTMDKAAANNTIKMLNEIVKGTELTLTSHYGYFGSAELL